MEYCRAFQDEIIKLYESLVRKGMHPSSPFYFNVKKYVKQGVTIVDMCSFIYDLGIQNPKFTFEECFLDPCVDNNKLTLYNSNYKEYAKKHENKK